MSALRAHVYQGIGIVIFGHSHNIVCFRFRDGCQAVCTGVPMDVNCRKNAIHAALRQELCTTTDLALQATKVMARSELNDVYSGGPRLTPLAQHCVAVSHEKVRFLDATIAQGGLFGETITVVKKPTCPAVTRPLQGVEVPDGVCYPAAPPLCTYCPGAPFSGGPQWTESIAEESIVSLLATNQAEVAPVPFVSWKCMTKLGKTWVGRCPK